MASLTRSSARLIAAAAVGALLGVIALACWWVVRDPAALADPTNAAQVALGRTVYERECARCHGAKLEGQPDWQVRLPSGRLPAPPHDPTGHTWHHPDRQLFQITKDGLSAVVPGYESDMPAYGAVLSDAEIWAVIAYIKSTWPREIRDRQQRLGQAG